MADETTPDWTQAQDAPTLSAAPPDFYAPPEQQSFMPDVPLHHAAVDPAVEEQQQAQGQQYMQQQANDAARQDAQAGTQKAQQNRVKAEDLRLRGIPTFTNASGDVAPVTDATGAPLTQFDPKNGIAYDSDGNAKAVSSNGLFQPPSVSNPFSGVPDFTDPKTGDVYKRVNGLPWEWEGQDPAIAGSAKQAAIDKLNKQTAEALGGPISQYHAQYNAARVNVVQSGKQLIQSGALPPMDGNGIPVNPTQMDPDQIKGMIDQNFQAQYSAPEANDTHFFGGLTADAQAIRDQLDARKAAAMSLADQHIANLQKMQGAQSSFDQLSQQQAGLRSDNLDAINQQRAAIGLDPVSLPAQAADGNQQTGANATNGQPPPASPAAAPSAFDSLPEQQKTALTAASQGEKAYSFDQQNGVQFQPGQLTKGIRQAVDDGLMDPDKAKDIAQNAVDADKAWHDREDLVAKAGGWSRVKAMLHGAGEGAAFLAGAPVGAGIGAEVGSFGGPLDPITVPVGSIIGGLLSGTAAAMGYKGLLNKLGQYNDTIDSFNKSAELHPVYDAAGNLLTFGAGLPRGLMKAAGTGIEAAADAAASASQVTGESASAVRATLAGQEAATAAGQKIANPETADAFSYASTYLDAVANAYKGSGGGLAAGIENLTQQAKTQIAGGATRSAAAATIAKDALVSAGTMVAIDTAVKEGGKAFGHGDGQTWGGVAQSAIVGAMMTGHGLNFPGYNSEQVGDIVTRGTAHDFTRTAHTDPLSASDMEAIAAHAGTDVRNIPASIGNPLTPEETEVYNAFKKAVSDGTIPTDPKGLDITAKQVLQAGRAKGIVAISAEKQAPGADVTGSGDNVPQSGGGLPSGGSPTEKPVTGKEIVTQGGAKPPDQENTPKTEDVSQATITHQEPVPESAAEKPATGGNIDKLRALGYEDDQINKMSRPEMERRVNAQIPGKASSVPAPVDQTPRTEQTPLSNDDRIAFRNAHPGTDPDSMSPDAARRLAYPLDEIKGKSPAPIENGAENESPKPLAVADRRSLEGRAQDAIDKLPAEEREKAQAQLDAAKRNHAQIRREHSDATTMGDQMRAQGEMVEQENRMRRLAGEKEQGASEPPTLLANEQSSTVPVASFTTAKGSNYYFHSDGTTVRNKAARPEHAGDSGIKDRSTKTVFVTPETARDVLDHVNVMHEDGDGTIVLDQAGNPVYGIYKDGPRKGDPKQWVSTKPIPVESATPKKGLVPLELWNTPDGKSADSYHVGNKITDVTEKSSTAPASETEPQTPGVERAADTKGAVEQSQRKTQTAVAEPVKSPIKTKFPLWPSQTDEHQKYGLTLKPEQVKSAQTEIKGIEKLLASPSKLNTDNAFENAHRLQQLREMLAAHTVATKKKEDGVAQTAVDKAAHEAATSPKNDLPEPTEAQKTGSQPNYKMGHPEIGPLKISIENPAGSHRRPEWPVMTAHYGYVKGTEGFDKDHVDIYVQPGTPEDYKGPVFVANQNKASGQFDEVKAIIGPQTEAQARQLYLDNHSLGAKLLHNIVKFDSVEDFDKWVKSNAPKKGEAKAPEVSKERKQLAAEIQKALPNSPHSVESWIDSTGIMRAVTHKDPESLVKLNNGMNMATLRAVAKVAGFTLPPAKNPTQKSVGEAIKAWAGTENYDKAVSQITSKNSERLAKEDEERRVRSLANAKGAAARIQVKTDSGEVVPGDVAIEGLFKRGFDKLVSTKKGAVTQWHLADSEGKSVALNTDLLRYAKMLAEQYEKHPEEKPQKEGNHGIENQRTTTSVSGGTNRPETESGSTRAVEGKSSSPNDGGNSPGNAEGDRGKHGEPAGSGAEVSDIHGGQPAGQRGGNGDTRSGQVDPAAEKSSSEGDETRGRSDIAKAGEHPGPVERSGIERQLDGALLRNQAILDKSQVVLQEGEKYKTAFAVELETGILHINTAALAKYKTTIEKAGGNFDKWLDSALDEEATHNIQANEIRKGGLKGYFPKNPDESVQSYFVRLYGSLTKEKKAAIKALYTPPKFIEKDMHPMVYAAEYTRASDQVDRNIPLPQEQYKPKQAKAFVAFIKAQKSEPVEAPAQTVQSAPEPSPTANAPPAEGSKLDAETQQQMRDAFKGLAAESPERDAIVAKHEKDLDAAIKKNAAEVHHEPASEADETPEAWYVSSPAKGNDRTANIYKRPDGRYGVDDENGMSVQGTPDDTLEDAISSGKYHVEAGDTQEGHELDTEARQEILHAIQIPDGAKLLDTQDTKWGSVYYKVRVVNSVDEDGEDKDYEDYKLSIRDHEPSPFREKEFGASDYWVQVPKNANPQQLSDAVSKIEDWISKKVNSDVSAVEKQSGNTAPDPKRIRALQFIASKRDLRPDEQAELDNLTQQKEGDENGNNTGKTEIRPQGLGGGTGENNPNNAGGTEGGDGKTGKEVSVAECDRQIAVARHSRDKEIARLGGITFTDVPYDIPSFSGLGMTKYGALWYNGKRLQEHLALLNTPDHRRTINAAFDEELLHRADTLTDNADVYSNEQDEIFDRLSPSARSLVEKAYGPDTNERLGAEYLRMLAQKRAGIVITEATHKDIDELDDELSNPQSPEAEAKVKLMLNLLGWGRQSLAAEEPEETLDAERAAMEGLGPKEAAVMSDIAKGKSISDIGSRLGIGETEVKSIIKNVGEAMDAAKDAAAKEIAEAIKSQVPQQNTASKAKKIRDIIKSLSDQGDKAEAVAKGFTSGFGSGKEAHAFIEQQRKVLADKLADLAKDSLPVDERGRFMKAVLNAIGKPTTLRPDSSYQAKLMYARAARVAGLIFSRQQELYKTGLADKIEKIVDQAKDNPSIDADYRDAIRDKVENLDFVKPTKKTLRRLESLKAFIDSKENEFKDVDMPDDVLARLDRLSKIHVGDLPNAVLETMLRDLITLDKLGRLKLSSQNQVKGIMARISADDIAGSVTHPWNERGIMQAQPTEKLGPMQILQNYANTLKNKGKNLLNGLSPIAAVLDSLGESKGDYDDALFRQIKSPFDTAHQEENGIIDTHVSPVLDALDKAKITKAQEDKIGLWLLMQQEGVEYRLQQSGVNQTVLNSAKSLTPEEMKIALLMRSEIDKPFPQLQRVAKFNYNLSVQKVEKYWPLMRDHSKMPYEGPPIVDPTTGKEIPQNETGSLNQLYNDYDPARRTATEKGFTVSRVKNAQTPVIVNAKEVFIRHMAQISHFIAFQSAVNHLVRVMKDPRMEVKLGTRGKRMILDLADTVARNGHVGAQHKIAWLDQLRKNLATYGIAFRVTSQFKHLSNIPFGMYHAGGANWFLRGAAAFRSDGAEQWIRENASEILHRAGGEPGIEELNQRSNAVKWGFYMARQVDLNNAASTFLGRYLKQRADAGFAPENWLTDPVDRNMMNIALNRMARAVPSVVAMNQPQAISRGSGLGDNVSVAKTIFAFSQFLLDQFSNLSHDFYRAGIRRAFAGDAGGMPPLPPDWNEENADDFSQDPEKLSPQERAKAASRAATVFLVVAAAILSETAIVEAWKKLMEKSFGEDQKKDDDFAKQLVIDAIRRVPFANNVIQMGLYGRTGIPSVDALVDPVKNTFGAVTGKHPETRLRAGERAAQGTLGVLGVPGAGQIGDLIYKSLPKYTPEHQKLVEAIRNGNASAVSQAVARGTIKPDQVAGIYREAAMTPQQVAAKKLIASQKKIHAPVFKGFP